MIVRELLTRLGFEIDKKPLHEFEHSVESIKHGLEGLKGALEVVGVGLSAYGVFEFFKGAAEASNQILSMSQKVGVGTDSLQRLSYAAKFSDLNLDSLGAGLKFLNRNFVEAQEGSKEATKAFTQLFGGSFNPKNFKSTEQLLLSISDRFKAMPDGPKKTALAMKVLGKAGADMIPFLNTGSESIRRLGDELEAFGGVLGVDALKAGEEFNNNLLRMKTFFVSLRNTIAARFFPAINHVLDSFVEFLKANKAIVKEKLDHYLNAIGNSVKFLASVVVVLWKGFDALSEALGSVEGGAIAASLALLGLGVIVGLVDLLTLAMVALGAAIFLVWEDYQTFLDGGESLIEWPKWIKDISDAWKKFKEIVEEVHQFLVKIDDLFTGFEKKVNPFLSKFTTSREEYLKKNPNDPGFPGEREKYNLPKPPENPDGLGIGAFIQKGVENGVNGGRGIVKARTRQELEDARSGDIGGIVPEILSQPILPPLLNQEAPAPAALVTSGGDKTLNNDVKVEQTINVNVQTNADVDQITEEVARRTREENDKAWQETDRALESGAFN